MESQKYDFLVMITKGFSFLFFFLLFFFFTLVCDRVAALDRTRRKQRVSISNSLAEIKLNLHQEINKRVAFLGS